MYIILNYKKKLMCDLERKQKNRYKMMITYFWSIKIYLQHVYILFITTMNQLSFVHWFLDLLLLSSLLNACLNKTWYNWSSSMLYSLSTSRWCILFLYHWCHRNLETVSNVLFTFNASHKYLISLSWNWTHNERLIEDEIRYDRWRRDSICSSIWDWYICLEIQPQNEPLKNIS